MRATDGGGGGPPGSRCRRDGPLLAARDAHAQRLRSGAFLHTKDKAKNARLVAEALLAAGLLLTHAMRHACVSAARQPARIDTDYASIFTRITVRLRSIWNGGRVRRRWQSSSAWPNWGRTLVGAACARLYRATPLPPHHLDLLRLRALLLRQIPGFPPIGRQPERLSAVPGSVSITKPAVLAACRT